MKIITCTVVAALFLSSCSNQRYGAISKVKHQSKTNVKYEIANKPLKSENIVVNSNEFLDIELPNLEETSVLPIEIQKSTPTNSQVNIPRKAKKSEKEAILLSRFALPLFPELNNQTQKLTERKIFQKDQNANESQASRGWFYYIVVGLIFFLLASLFFDTLAGSIFALVGLIAIIYGLLALIDIV